MTILFWFLGLVIGSFTLISALICLFFGIPIARAMDSEKLLQPNNGIIKRYISSVLILSSIFALITAVIYLYLPANYWRGYIGGAILSLVFGISKIGKNKDNLSDFITMNTRYFIDNPDSITEFFYNKFK